MSENTSPTVHKSSIITQLIGAVVFVGVPVLLTMMAPITRMTFEKQAAGVTATTRKCLLLCIPYRTEVVSPVTEVTKRLVKGRSVTADERRRGRSGRTEDDGSIILHGPQTTATIQVSPVNLDDTTEKIELFLKNPQEIPLQMTVVANWKISIIVGGIATAFAALYVVGSILASAWWLIRLLGPGVARKERSPANED